MRDKTRPPASAAGQGAVVERTLREPPGAVTHWTGRAMAKAMGLSLRTIQRIWAAHKVQPHRIRTFKRSNDPDFAAKLDDVVGLYMNPPRHAAVVSIDEKSQIQALDRTQPGLPLKRGKCATLTHDYRRHGTTTLFAALSVLEGKVIGRCGPRHRHQEFIRFIATVERSVPAGKVIHAILDNYAAHKHPQVLAWLAEHPRWTFHFTPTSCSWLNAVEGFFSKLTRQSLKRGVFRSVDDLESAITRRRCRELYRLIFEFVCWLCWGRGIASRQAQAFRPQRRERPIVGRRPPQIRKVDGHKDTILAVLEATPDIAIDELRQRSRTKA